MSLNRAYSLLDIKSIDAEQRVIVGIATTPSTDRMDDIVESEGAQFKLPLPLLWQHDSRQPIGEVFAAKVTPAGIEIKARIAQIDEPGTLKNRLDEAFQSIKAGLVRGLSIGFKSIEDADIKGTFGRRFLKWMWLELSAVTIPANADATIHTVKQFDLGAAATGTGAEGEVTPKSTGASVITRVVKTTRQDMKMPKPIAERIKELEATLLSKTSEMNALDSKVSDEGRTKDESEKETFKGLLADIEALQEEIADQRKMEAINAKAAKPVAGKTSDEGAATRGNNNHVITVKDNLFPGQRFARLAMCVAMSKGSRSDAIALAQQFYPEDARMVDVIKTAVGAGTTASGGGPLVQYTDFFGDFVEFLRPQTIIGKFGTNGIPSLRRVPFNSRVSTQTAGGSGYWVGEGKPKPLTKGTFSTITLTFNKVAAISVLTQEEVRFATPSAEQKVRDDLAAGLIQKLDADFVDPAKAVSAGVSPASITNGLTPHVASGTNAAAVRADFASLMGDFITAEIDPINGVFLMSPTRALQLSLMMNSLSAAEFPNITMTGGRLFGFPVIVSSALATGSSPSTDLIVFVNASDVYLADDGGVSVEASTEASLEMLDSALQQDATNGTGASLVSLWQTNCVGLRAEREITWKLRRAAGASYISNAAYTA